MYSTGGLSRTVRRGAIMLLVHQLFLAQGSDRFRGTVSAKLASNASHRTLLRPTEELLGCEVPEIEMIQPVGLSGTLIVNDKSKGVTWLLDLSTRTFKSVELPLVGGSHETAVSVDGRTIAVPQYEFPTQKGQGEGGGSPGFGVSLIDIKTGQPQFLRSGA